MKRTWFAVAAAAAAALVGAAAVAWPQGASSAADESENGITVTAVGSSKAIPDRAQLSFGVSTQGTTAEAASSANADRMNGLIEALKAASVPKENIRTESLSVSPRRSPAGTRLPGFVSENTVSVTVASARAGAIADLAVENGATSTSGPSFDLSARDAIYRDALADAVREARKKAEAIGRAGGVSVGDVTRVVEGAETGPPVFAEALARDQAKATPVEPGQDEVHATLTVTFAVGR